jgi:hypothetical protein
MKLVKSLGYTAVQMSISQLMLMNKAEALLKYPYYAANQEGPIGETKLLLEYVACLFANTQCQPNNCLIWALSDPVEQYSMVSENLAAQGINEENNYTDTIGKI